MPSLKWLLSDAMHLFYPHNCMGCGSDLLSKADLICLRCGSDLPYTHFEKMINNPVEKIFYGRIPLISAQSSFYFSKGKLIQQLIHELKYKGNQVIGEWLGTRMGNLLLQSGRFTGIDYMVPLPLFRDKQFKRGYNQAEVICNGMYEAMQVPILINNVIRKRATETQTKKHRRERWENVDGSFAVINPGQLAGKHILLVDDVITTGASLEACARVLLQVAGVGISIATVAIASK